MTKTIRTIENLRDYLQRQLPDTRIWPFGSRAAGRATPHSDIDIALLADCDLRLPMARIRETLDESLLPYKVDLVDLSQAPHLRPIVEKEGIRWQ
ncbi:nucleotidyltransferase family protein [Hydrogenimonas sp.]